MYVCMYVCLFVCLFVWYGMVWYGMVWYGMVWYGMVCMYVCMSLSVCIVLYCIVLYCIVLYCIVLYCIVWYGMVWYGIVLYVCMLRHSFGINTWDYIKNTTYNFSPPAMKDKKGKKSVLITGKGPTKTLKTTLQSEKLSTSTCYIPMYKRYKYVPNEL